MTLTKSQKEFLELIQDAETVKELAEIAKAMKPEDKRALGPDIHAATERIVHKTKGF